MTHFNLQAKTYARYRPTYHAALAEKLAALVKYRGVCWDAGTGNGQMALLMAEHFNLVCASDIGEKSLAEAPGHKGILYSRQPAEKTDFPDDFFDLVVVAQAAHWFDLPAFYDEVKRVAKREAAIALIGYGRPTMQPALQHIYNQADLDLLSHYWDKRIGLLEDRYARIPFPFDEIEMETGDLVCHWTAEQLTGFMRSWSAVQQLAAEQGTDQLEALLHEMSTQWPQNEPAIEIRFPMFCRAGYVFPGGQKLNL